MENTEGTAFSPKAELSAAGAEAAWYCVRSHLKHEHIAAAHLELIPGVEVFNPQLRLLRSTRRGRVWYIESLFPNYVFARFVLQQELEKVRHTTGVAMVVHFGDTAPAIPGAVIEGLKRDMEELGSKVLIEAPEKGEDVEVASGAFKGLQGSVMSVLPAKQRVRILIDFMGRTTAVELSLGQLIFRKREAASLVLPHARAIPRKGAKRKGPVSLAAEPPTSGLNPNRQGPMAFEQWSQQ